MSKQRTQNRSTVSATATKPAAPAVDLPVELALPDDQPVAVEYAAASPVPAAAEATETYGPRPSYEDFKAAAEMGMCVRARLRVGKGPALRSALVLDDQDRTFSLRPVLEAGESHLRGLATDPDIEARIVEAG